MDYFLELLFAFSIPLLFLFLIVWIAFSLFIVKQGLQKNWSFFNFWFSIYSFGLIPLAVVLYSMDHGGDMAFLGYYLVTAAAIGEFILVGIVLGIFLRLFRK